MLFRSSIAGVRPTRSALSSPALSLDRLRIDHGAGGRRTVLVSPADRAGFVQALQLPPGVVQGVMPDGVPAVRQGPDASHV